MPNKKEEYKAMIERLIDSADATLSPSEKEALKTSIVDLIMDLLSTYGENKPRDKNGLFTMVVTLPHYPENECCGRMYGGQFTGSLN